ncbi:uncharacterized protein B0T15DRAFT_574518 [Chaetomium strumarium]|uniref:Uncharacterized protein n=1 Tax=Chaetomium strumarium TaxID=1170767 RepID=A0AAJ0GS23_9PEZI|nr:hypothetical protein B0T15DRAFT_574518 [Chaetomium strumarium]
MATVCLDHPAFANPSVSVRNTDPSAATSEAPLHPPPLQEARYPPHSDSRHTFPVCRVPHDGRPNVTVPPLVDKNVDAPPGVSAEDTKKSSATGALGLDRKFASTQQHEARNPNSLHAKDTSGSASYAGTLFMTRLGLFGLFPGESPHPLLGMWPKGMVLDCGLILAPPQSCGPETQQGADSSCFSQHNDHYGGSNRTSDPKHCHPPLPDHRREQTNEKGSVVPPQGQECQTSIRRLSDNESENEWGCNLPNAEPPIPLSASQDRANLQHNIDRRRHCGIDGEDSGPIENGATEQARDDAATQLPRKRRRMSPSTPTTHETASRPQTRLYCAGLQPPRAQPSKHRRSQRGLFIPPSSGTSTSKDETKAPVAKVEEWPLDGAVLRRVIVKGVTTFQLQWDASANREQKQRTPGIPRRKSAAERTSSTGRGGMANVRGPHGPECFSWGVLAWYAADMVILGVLRPLRVGLGRVPAEAQQSKAVNQSRGSRLLLCTMPS